MLFFRWILGPLAFALILMAGAMVETELPPAALKMLAVMAWIVLWWIFETIPLAVTSLLGPLLCILIGVAPPAKALEGFSNPVIFLFLGGFLIAQAMRRHGVDQAIAARIIGLGVFRLGLMRNALGLYVSAFFLSMWISNTATAAVLMPVGLLMLSRIEENARARVAPIFLLGLAYSCSIAGITTPVGSPPNAIALGMLREVMGVTIPFLQWMLFALPAALLLFGILLLVVSMKIRAELRGGEVDQAVLFVGNALNSNQRLVMSVLGGAIFLWLAPSLFPALPLGSSTVALIAAVLLFILPLKSATKLLDWEEAKKIDWGTLLLFGGGLSLGNLIFETGLAAELKSFLPSRDGSYGFLFPLIAVSVAIFLTELTSNTATANLIVPVLLAGAGFLGGQTLATVFAATLACSLAFMLPVATPPNAIIYSSGRVQIRQMVRLGLWMNLISIGVLLIFEQIWSRLF